MKLSKRLQAICDFIPNNSNIIDVGADHALVDIYLTKYKNCHCLATDISENAIENAKNNIDKFKVNVKTKVTDGLKNIDLNDQIIVISGMGTHTIMKILNKRITNDIIISSHKNIALLRKFMMKKGYHIYKELAIKDKYYYIITYYKYGKKKKTNYVLSPFLINNKDYMMHLSDYYKLKYNFEKNIFKKIKYKKLLFKINQYIKKEY